MENKLTPDVMMEFIEGLDAAAVLDEHGAYTYVSPGWERYTGIPACDALGKRVWDLIPDTHAREVYQTKKPLFARVVRKHGIPAFTSYFPRLREDGSVCGVFLYIIFYGMDSAHDMTQRIRELNNTVEFYRQELARERGARYSIDSIAGESAAVAQLKDQIVRAARSSSTVLIEGETGSGKELVAHAIHALSDRQSSNFVRVNCSAIPPELLESEFFGYAAGAFTGAARKGKLGRFALANGGTIFLDEVNLLTSTMQPKFLRVLQEREIDPVGGDKSIPVDVRVIAASNVPLEALVAEGKFRQDLYYRLNIICIRVPTLRERVEDIPALTETFIRRLNRQLGMAVQGAAPEVMELFMAYHWPGNIRELQNAVESAMNITDATILTRKDFWQLEQRVRRNRRQNRGPEASQYLLRPAKAAFEREFIVNALEAAGGNKVKAAEMLGVSRTVLYDKLELYHLK